MKHRFVPSLRAAAFLVAALGTAAPILTPLAQAVPKPKLEIWPDRRVLLVLPLQVSPTWNADPQLGQAILPLAQPQLQRALSDTGKFSVTLPYRFDPVLRRGLTEKQLADNDITTMLQTPTLANSVPVINKLNFDQPVMTTEVSLEELTIGGDAKKPTVQLQVSGKLYEQGALKDDGSGREAPTLVRTETYRSKPVGGKTPSDRLTAAANAAFSGLAAAFVQPPAAFDLPAPIEVAPVDDKGAGKPSSKTGGKTAPAKGSTSGAAPASGATPASGGSVSTPPASAPVAPPTPLPSVATPNPLPATPGAPIVPQLPAGAPPLGVTPGQGTAAGR